MKILVGKHTETRYLSRSERWSDGFAIAAVCAFVFLANYRIELPVGNDGEERSGFLPVTPFF